MPYRMREPLTRGEWRDAVDAAAAALCLDAARSYGLVVGGPAVDVDRCSEILAGGESRGIAPSDDAVDRFVSAWSAQQKAGVGS